MNSAQNGTPRSDGMEGSAGSQALAAAAGVLSALSARAPSGDDMKGKALAIISNSRPWSEFANSSQMSVPSVSEIRDRVEQNSQYYIYNYATILVALSVITVLVSPLSILGLVAILGAYTFLYILNPDRIQVGPVSLDQRTKGAALALFALIILWLTGAGSTFITLLCVVGCVSVVHMLLRKPPGEADFDTAFTNGSAV
mmetsp:Transcript_3216/g.6986  ORF Transcript_3216/g.6986 Transcript_3216/m.6986 type:complete len:199 (-) Transcript_3216:1186-1782(-)